MHRMLVVVLSSLFLLPLSACQAETESAVYEAGKHYEVLPQPVPTSSPDHIEVAEVFWYGCSHCFTFESLVSDWKKSLAEDTRFVGVPAVWHPDMALHAKAYFTAKALKVLDKVHLPIFEAMNIDKKKLKTEEEIAAIFVAQGVSAENFSKTFNSWGIAQQVKLYESKQRGYRTKGTPELVVNGKYRISTRRTDDPNQALAGGQAGMLKVATFLIEKERQAQE